MHNLDSNFVSYPNNVLAIFLLSFFLRQSITLSPRLKCSGPILAYCNPRLLRSNDSPASGSPVAGFIGAHHHAWLIFKIFFVEMGSPSWVQWP